jgi:hypothetical protein
MRMVGFAPPIRAIVRPNTSSSTVEPLLTAHASGLTVPPGSSLAGSSLRGRETRVPLPLTPDF